MGSDTDRLSAMKIKATAICMVVFIKIVSMSTSSPSKSSSMVMERTTAANYDVCSGASY